MNVLVFVTSRYGAVHDIAEAMAELLSSRRARREQLAHYWFSTNSDGGANWRMTYTNNSTGAIDFSAGTSTVYMSSGTVDEDWAAFSTTYTVALTVTDPYSGAVLASKSALVTTKAPKEGA